MVQRTFSIIRTFNETSAEPKPPMTSKQVKAPHKKSTRGKPRSRSEERREEAKLKAEIQEDEEKRRIAKKKETDDKKCANIYKKKKASDKAADELLMRDRKRQGLPPKPTSPRQRIISGFVTRGMDTSQISQQQTTHLQATGVTVDTMETGAVVSHSSPDKLDTVIPGCNAPISQMKQNRTILTAAMMRQPLAWLCDEPSKPSSRRMGTTRYRRSITDLETTFRCLLAMELVPSIAHPPKCQSLNLVRDRKALGRPATTRRAFRLQPPWYRYSFSQAQNQRYLTIWKNRAWQHLIIIESNR